MLTVSRGHGRDAGRADVPPEELAGGFGVIESLYDERLAPGACLAPEPAGDAEILTYVHEGALVYQDSTGRGGVLRSGDVQHRTGTRGSVRTGRNASATQWAHIVRVRLHSNESGGEPSDLQRCFTSAERWGKLYVVATPDERDGSLRLHADALMFSAILPPGTRLVYPLGPRRSAWLHVVQGSVALGDVILVSGDGAGVHAERSVSFTALEHVTLLLVDTGKRRPARAGNPIARIGAAPALPCVAFFKTLWDALADVLGPAATAALVGRAAHSALPRCPELGELAIARAERGYRYVVPRCFHEDGATPAALRELVIELEPLLVQLTGQVVLRSLDRNPDLCEWRKVDTPQDQRCPP